MIKALAFAALESVAGLALEATDRLFEATTEAGIPAPVAQWALLPLTTVTMALILPVVAVNYADDLDPFARSV